jgi:hypothetical protein
MDATFYLETMGRRQQSELAAAAELRRRMDERAVVAEAAPARPSAWTRGLRRLRVRVQTA